MVAILLIALAGAGRTYAERRVTFARLADHHLGEMAAMVNVSRATGHQADVWEGKAPREAIYAFLMPVSDTRSLRECEAVYAKRADYHAALSQKYREAAEHPWVAVQPDPPSP